MAARLPNEWGHYVIHSYRGQNTRPLVLSFNFLENVKYYTLKGKVHMIPLANKNNQIKIKLHLIICFLYS